MALDTLVVWAAVFGLWWGAVWPVEGAAHLAKRLGMVGGISTSRNLQQIWYSSERAVAPT